MNNSNNNGVNSCFALLRQNKPEGIDNPTTGDINNILADVRTVSKELHKETKQILISAVRIVDSNGTLPSPDFIKHVFPNIHPTH